MATSTATIAAPPTAVFAVLADGWLYSDWVVGSSHLRAVDANWPAAGSRLHHATGIWPAVTRDESVVEEVTAPYRLVLTAKGRPFGQARVVLELEASAAGTLVTMTETPIAGPGRWARNRFTDALLARRNVETLARLAAVAERRTEPSD